MTSLLVAFALGCSVWSLAEYLIHRFVGHGASGNWRFRKEHLQHHAEVHYFAPPRTKVLMAAGPLLGTAVVSSFLLGPATGLTFTAGFGLTYLGYELCHWRIHYRAPKGPWGALLRKHHFSHHFDDARVNHGVTSPWWDRLFGTHVPSGRISVPSRRAPCWLIDPHTRDVRDAYRADYELRIRLRKSA